MMLIQCGELSAEDVRCQQPIEHLIRFAPDVLCGVGEGLKLHGFSPQPIRTL